MTRFEIEKQFKEDFNMTINEAERVLSKKKRDSDEVYYINCLLGGFDIRTGLKAKLDDNLIKAAKERIQELTK